MSQRIAQGQTFGQYELDERLGAGGMGEVWLARHRLLQRSAAIKLIRSDTEGIRDPTGGMQLCRRFEREARATSVLKSPHTVQIYDFGTTDDGTFYYAMELLDGWNLADFVTQHGPVEPGRVLTILQQACESLAEAHEHGLVHRDIKPANIYLCKLGIRYDHVKLLDFGLVKVGPESGVDVTQLTGAVTPGTPEFMSPEIVRGTADADGRSDLYALGCVGYWLLTGQLVFDRESMLDVVMAHLKEAPQPPSARTTFAVSPELETVLLRCLEKDPARRPQSATELAAELAACPVERAWTPADAEKWWSATQPPTTGRTTDSEREAIFGGTSDPITRAQPARETGRRADSPSTSIRIARRFLGTPQPTPVRGRPEALATVDAFVAGRSGLLLLVGEAGIGKTRLAVHALECAEDAGTTVLGGSGLDLQDTAPYMPFMDAWSDHARGQGADENAIPFLEFAPTQGGAPQEDTLRLFRAVETSLAAIAGQRSAALLIDDLHLADESSLHLLHFLARASRTQPFMLVATCRSEKLEAGTPLHDVIDNLSRERLVTRIDVERLGMEGARASIADLIGEEPDDGLVESVHRLSGGNPFFIEEIVQARTDATDPSSDTEIPASLSDSLRARVARLGADVERLLRAASIIGSRFGFSLAQRVSALSLDSALDAAESAVRARLIEEDGDGYRFRHALVRESIYGGLLEMRRNHLHELTASALQDMSPNAHEELAFHFRAGGRPDSALPHLFAAGQAAMQRIGFREALAFFEHARRIMDDLEVPAGPERFALLEGLGMIRLALSECPQSMADLDSAAALERIEDGWRPDPTDRARTRRSAALACMNIGDLGGMDTRLRAAMQDVAEAPLDPEWPEILYLVAQMRWHEAKHDAAFETAELCLAKAEALGEPSMVARAYEMLALACHSLGEWKQGRAFEESRQALVGGPVDVAQAFDAHL